MGLFDWLNGDQQEPVPQQAPLDAPPTPEEIADSLTKVDQLAADGHVPPAVLSRGDRFILRAYSPPITIAGGLVLDPHPARSAIRTAVARDRFEKLDPGGLAPTEAADRAVAVMVTERGAVGLSVAALVSRAGFEPEQTGDAIERLSRAGMAVRAGDVLVSPAVLETLTTARWEARSTRLTGLRTVAYDTASVYDYTLEEIGGAWKVIEVHGWKGMEYTRGGGVHPGSA